MCSGGVMVVTGHLLFHQQDCVARISLCKRLKNKNKMYILLKRSEWQYSNSKIRLLKEV